jgi:hypothetical protein
MYSYLIPIFLFLNLVSIGYSDCSLTLNSGYTITTCTAETTNACARAPDVYYKLIQSAKNGNSGSDVFGCESENDRLATETNLEANGYTCSGGADLPKRKITVCEIDYYI